MPKKSRLPTQADYNRRPLYEQERPVSKLNSAGFLLPIAMIVGLIAWAVVDLLF